MTSPDWVIYNGCMGSQGTEKAVMTTNWAVLELHGIGKSSDVTRLGRLLAVRGTERGWKSSDVNRQQEVHDG